MAPFYCFVAVSARRGDVVTGPRPGPLVQIVGAVLRAIARTTPVYRRMQSSRSVHRKWHETAAVVSPNCWQRRGRSVTKRQRHASVHVPGDLRSPRYEMRYSSVFESIYHWFISRAFSSRFSVLGTSRCVERATTRRRSGRKRGDRAGSGGRKRGRFVPAPVACPRLTSRRLPRGRVYTAGIAGNARRISLPTVAGSSRRPVSTAQSVRCRVAEPGEPENED